MKINIDKLERQIRRLLASQTVRSIRKFVRNNKNKPYHKGKNVVRRLISNNQK